MLRALNFPPQFIVWILACVSSPSFSLKLNGGTYGLFQGKRGLRQGDPLSPPLLFVVCMDYLSRILTLVANNSTFQFHHRCKNLKLNHLVFADDLIIFSRDKDSVMLLLRSLATFAASSGLNANAGKSAMYCCNMKPVDKDFLLHHSGYSEGNLPFKYLRVKISAKKLNKADCQLLVDKVISRMRSWGTRTLSYAGRAQLVNFVLLTLHSYWASIFILPKAVIDGVMTMCRNYLWNGTIYAKGSPPVAWDLVCGHKKYGGLGFKEISTWNIAMMGKYIWNLASKSDNLWVQWINHVSLKNQDWKHHTPKANSSWYWKQICTVRDKLKDGFNGYIWTPNPVKYTISSAYKWLRGESIEVNWDVWVWNRLNIPKHSVIAWLIMWKRIKTRDRLARFGYNHDTSCPLCRDIEESVDHSYFKCYYSRRCCSLLFSVLQLQLAFDSLDGCNGWLQKPIQGKFKKNVIRSCVVSLLYYIWKQRNSAIWEQKISRPENVIQSLKFDVFNRISAVMPRKTSGQDKLWLTRLLNS